MAQDMQDTPHSVDSLREQFRLEAIARRLGEGQTMGQVARDCNIRPGVLAEMVKDESFLTILERFDLRLAEDIRAEREAEKPSDYESTLLKEAAESVKTLVTLRDTASSENQRQGAAKAVIEMALKVKAQNPERQHTRVVFPQSQIKALQIACKEVRALEELRLLTPPLHAN